MTEKKTNSSARGCNQTAVTIITILISVCAIAATFFVPEVRKMFGLEPEDSVTPVTVVVTRIAPETEVPTEDIPPSPTSIPSFNFPTAVIPTSTPEADVIFSDNFDDGLTGYWQTVGDWMTTNGLPAVVQAPQTTNAASAFAWGKGGLILQGAAGYDDYAIEFDFYDGFSALLFSYVDEDNYKAWRIVNNGDEFFIDPGCQLVFVSNDNATLIPQSNIPLYYNYVGANHVRVEIHGSSLTLFLNGNQLYSFTGLPDTMTGSIGVVGTVGRPVIDNLVIYRLTP